MTKAAAEIRKIFDRYSKELSDQKKTMTQQITDWRNERVREIELHMTEAMKRLDKEYKKQKSSLETTCQEFLTQAAQEKQKDNEKIRLLLDQCKELQFKLAAIEHHKHQIEFIEVMEKDQPTQTNRNGSNVPKTEENQSQNRSTEDDDNDTGNSASAIESSPPKPTSANSKQTSRRSSTTQISPSLDQSTSGDDNLKPDVKSGDDTTNKCPVCFMIFPQSMIKYDREQHVNEHYGDD